MNHISIHPASALLGLAFGVLILLSMSQTPPLNARNVNVQYLPDPRDMVVIREGTPFTVPAGKILVVTALGANEGYQFSTLKVNGADEVLYENSTATTPSVQSLGTGLALPAGSVVEPFALSGTANNGRAWGYLAPQ